MIISFDCESASLTGQTFAVGAVTSTGETFFRIMATGTYTPCQWVADNVMPAIMGRVQEQHYVPDYRSLCLAFFDWVMSHTDVTLVADWGMPVEGRFWADCLRFAAERSPGSEFSAPCPVHEIATALLVSRREREKSPLTGGPGSNGTSHDPVYDAAVSLRDWLAVTR